MKDTALLARDDDTDDDAIERTAERIEQVGFHMIIDCKGFPPTPFGLRAVLSVVIDIVAYPR